MNEALEEKRRHAHEVESKLSTAVKDLALKTE